MEFPLYLHHNFWISWISQPFYSVTALIEGRGPFSWFRSTNDLPAVVLLCALRAFDDWSQLRSAFTSNYQLHPPNLSIFISSIQFRTVLSILFCLSWVICVWNCELSFSWHFDFQREAEESRKNICFLRSSTIFLLISLLWNKFQRIQISNSSTSFFLFQ